jgi:hypothetical protein
MENAPAWDGPQIDDEFAQAVSFPSLLRTPIREQGFTEVRLRNPQNGEVRVLNIACTDRKNKALLFVVSAPKR